MELQLQTLLCTIISIRQARKHYGADEILQKCIYDRLADLSTTAHLDSTLITPSDSMELLESTTRLCDEIASTETSLIKHQLAEIKDIIELNVLNGRFPQAMRDPFVVGFTKHWPTSPTETFRIRRALWRLRLYYEAFHEPFIPMIRTDLLPAKKKRDCHDTASVNSQKLAMPHSETWVHGEASNEAEREYVRSQGVFISHLNVWELEEMDCVWYYLTYQSKTLWRRPCPGCAALILPDRLIAHMHECRDLSNLQQPRSDSYGDFRDACSYFRPILDYYGPATKSLKWPDSNAQGPNAGFKFFEKRHPELEPFSLPLNLARNNRLHVLSWGYCWWNRKRLMSWHMINGPCRRDRAVLDWWRVVP